jgi:selenocysteine lyase/cysteine desulfurase
MDYDMYDSPYRNLVVGVDTQVPLSNGSYVTYINFDNAATTPPFKSVLNEIEKVAPWYSSINRGQGYKSQVTSNYFENARDIILDFVKGDRINDTVIFVKNATEGINKLASKLCSKTSKCVVLSTNMEHHSNDLPWREKYQLDYIELDKDGKLSIEDLINKLQKYTGLVKLVTISGASNVTGFINPIYDIAKLAHQYGAKILVDGAQYVPHVPMDMKPVNSPEHIDYLVFSAHKMYAPFGIGVLIGPKGAFEAGEPDYKGGGTVKLVTHEFISWNDPPSKEEAGTPNFMGVAALVASINTLNYIGMSNVDNYEKRLAEYALSKLRLLKDIEIYGNFPNYQNRVAILPFNISGMHHTQVAKILSSEAGIAVRTGCFCAQPYVQKLLNISMDEVKELMRSPEKEKPGMVRLSFGLYNSFYEIDELISILSYIIKNKQRYIKKYSNK